MFTDPSGNNELNTELLFDVSNAMKVLKKYFNTFYLQEDTNRVSRSEKKAPLMNTPILRQNIVQNKKNETEKQTSHTFKILYDLWTKDDALDRLIFLKQKFAGIIDKIPLRTAKKDAVISELAAAHKRLVEFDPGWLRALNVELDKTEMNIPSFAEKARKREELRVPFYQFPLESKLEFLDIKHHIQTTDEADIENEDEELVSNMYQTPCARKKRNFNFHTPFS